VTKFLKPVKMSPSRLESASSQLSALGINPAQRSEVAHETASAFLARGKTLASKDMRRALVDFTDKHGLDTLADLWSQSHPITLPGALWRLYLVRAVIRQNPADFAGLFVRGAENLRSIETFLNSSAEILSGEDLLGTWDSILSGIFSGDISSALDRAGAVARAISAGAISISWDDESDAIYLTARAIEWNLVAEELALAAKEERKGGLS